MNFRQLPGDIRAFNINTGKLEWTFHVIPSQANSVLTPGARTPGNATVGLIVGQEWHWTKNEASCTYRLLLLHLIFYGADRPGQNLFANCLLALNAKTGERIWHYQTTHHDLWDRDNGSPPNLVTIKRDGKEIDAVRIGYENGIPVYV
jgi:quinoprotein glucose dehydrogenase